mmetsp:Transcript_23704/g.75125  ORF Transcript_23704/g.75125 Transcript_23704/m.75125 type:complete len:101 (+) Transcript_23704:507-809(+)
MPQTRQQRAVQLRGQFQMEPPPALQQALAVRTWPTSPAACLELPLPLPLPVAARRLLPLPLACAPLRLLLLLLLAVRRLKPEGQRWQPAGACMLLPRRRR